MKTDDTAAEVLAALGEIAPEIDPGVLDHSAPLRDEVDLDSMDFLNFIVALHERFGVDIPESDYQHLATLNDCVAYIEARM